MRQLNAACQFQSTSPCGEQPAAAAGGPATTADFNPHPRVGSNPGRRAVPRMYARFQSTSPCGEQPFFPALDARGPADFNPHPRVGSNGASACSTTPLAAYFNPHPRVGSNTQLVFLTLTVQFQSTSPCGEQRKAAAKRREKEFQSTSPCGEQRTSSRRRSGSCQFQSTSPCGEQQAPPEPAQEATPISIHIPVWGATESGGKAPGEGISIHIPVWGATRSGGI